MIFSHKGLESGGRDVIRASLVVPPLHEGAVGDASKHSQNPDAIITLHSASVIVIGDVQTLVQSAFNSPALSVEKQPERGR